MDARDHAMHDRRVSSTNPESEYEALLHVVRRAAERFPSVGEDAIVEIVAAEVARFDAVQLRAYIPVLVEHDLLERLRRSVAA